MSDHTIHLIWFVLSVAVITAIYITVETEHIHIQLSTLIQALPVIVAAVTAIQRALTSGQGGSTTSTTTVKTDPTAKNIHVEVTPGPEPIPIKGTSPKDDA